jgi:hypothetical protein
MATTVIPAPNTTWQTLASGNQSLTINISPNDYETYGSGIAVWVTNKNSYSLSTEITMAVATSGGCELITGSAASSITILGTQASGSTSISRLNYTDGEAIDVITTSLPSGATCVDASGSWSMTLSGGTQNQP